MATQVLGCDIYNAPHFDGTNFDSWKLRMKTFLKSLDFKLWSIVEKGFISKPKASWNEEDKRNFSLNIRAMKILLGALYKDVYDRVSSYKSAKSIFDTLELYYGTNMICPLIGVVEVEPQMDGSSLQQHNEEATSNAYMVNLDEEVTSSSCSSSNVNAPTYDDLLVALEKMHASLEKFHKENKALRTENKSLNLENKGLKNKNEAFSFEKDDKIKNLQNEIKFLKNENTSLKDEIGSLKMEKEKLKSFEYSNEILEKEICKLKKFVSSLENDLEFMKIENNSLKIENDSFKNKNNSLKTENGKLKCFAKENEEKINDLNQIIYKFTNGKNNFEKLLSSQRFCLQKVGLGFKSSNYKSFLKKSNILNEKNYLKNYFVKASSCDKKCFENNTIRSFNYKNDHVHVSSFSCNYCSSLGHLSYSCPYKKKDQMGVKKIWVPKGTQVQKSLCANLVGPKVIWVPKSKA